MKKLLIGLVAASALIAGPAMAADMPLKAPPAPPPAACIWCGFYIGVNVGGAWSTTNDAGSFQTVAGGPITAVFPTSENLSGVIGGGQIGYNWQWSSVVLGVEADVDGSSQRGTGSSPFTFVPAIVPPTAAGVTMQEANRINDFGTIRARLGLPFNNWLPYVTGGFAWQNVSTALTGIAVAPAPFPGNFPLMSNSNTLTGWTIGGGVEAKMWGAWSIRAEYLYIDTGRYNTTTGALAATSPAVAGGFTAAGTVFNESTRFTNNVFRVGVNYYFGGPASIATRY
jgi:outer membrane immunogenic protein